MYKFVNFQLAKDADKLVKKNWNPTKGKISGNSIEFDEDCSSYLYYGNVSGRDADLSELKRMLNNK
jgi:hypothetical protein